MKNKVKVIISIVLVALAVLFILLSLTLPVYNTDIYYLPGYDQNGNYLGVGSNTATHCGTLSYYLGTEFVAAVTALYAVTFAINGISVALNVTDIRGKNVLFFTGAGVFAAAVFAFILTFVLAATGNFFCY